MRPIDADYLIERLNKLDTMKGIGLEPVMAMRDVKALISVMPTIDTEKHAYWIGGELGECSACHCEGCASDIWNHVKSDGYCPNCGAKMDLEAQDAKEKG